MSREPGAGTWPIGVSTAAAWPSMRSTTHLRTRLFSPKPGHRKSPSVVAAEPVDVEDLGQLGRVVVLADLDPVVEVVAGVVADEGQHRHRVAADDADLADRRGGRLRGERGAHERAVHPVAGLGHQRDGGLAATTEEDRVDRHAARVVVLGRQDRALLDRRAVARVRVAGELADVGRPVLALPRRGVGRGVLQALPPDVAVVGQRDVGEHRVAHVDGLHRVGVGVLVGAGRDAEEAVLRVDGPQPAVLADPHPGDVVADRLDLPARDGRGEHGEVGLAAGAREGRGDVLA